MLKKRINISILGCNWLGIPLGKTLLKKGFLVKGSSTTLNKLKKIEIAGLKPYLIKFNPQINKNYSKEFFICDLLIILLPPRYKKKEYDYFQVVKEIIKEVKRNCIPAVFFASSTAVYDGKPNSSLQIIDEKFVLKKKEGKAAFLWNTEILLTKQKAFRYIIFRIGGLLGRNRNPKYFIKKSNRKSNGGYINFIHSKDVINIMVTLIEKKTINNEIYNLVSDYSCPRAFFYNKIAKKLKITPPIFENKKSFLKTVSNEKIKKEIGYRFKYKNMLKWVLSTIR